MLPLEKLRVVDQTSTEFAVIARMLSELGADVIRVEPGQCRAGPSSADRAWLQEVMSRIGKQTVHLDPSQVADRLALQRLITSADIWIHTSDALPFSAARDLQLSARSENPSLVIFSIADFGPGRHSHWRATDGVLHALTGGLARSGLQGRPPLLPPDGIAIQCAALQALYLLLLSHTHRVITGAGDHIQVAKVDMVAQSLDPVYGIAGVASANHGNRLPTRARPDVPQQYPIIPCRDGFVRICLLSQRQWQAMFEWLGRPEEFSDPAFNILHKRLASRTLIDRITTLFQGNTRDALERAGQTRGIPISSLNAPMEFVRSAHMRERCAFVHTDTCQEQTLLVPNGLLTIDGIRAGTRRDSIDRSGARAKRIEWPRRTPRQPSTPSRSISHEHSQPLKGIRVLDLGTIVVGAEQGRLLADYGAEVIKIESHAFPDGSRQTPDGRNMSRSFAAGNRNKKSFAIDLRTSRGRELFLRLVEKSDVVLANFRPGVLASLGLDDAILRDRNSRLVIGHSSAYGSTGAYRTRRGYGPILRASTGLTAAWRYADDPAGFGDSTTVYPDHAAARLLIAGVLSLLARHQLTNTGGTVDVAQAEIALNVFSERIAEHSMQQHETVIPAPAAEHDAPWGVYPCAGDDEWCVVTVENDLQWRSLCEVIGRRDLREDLSLCSRAGRLSQRSRIDECLARWLAVRTPEDAMYLLQDNGVPAAAMLRSSELPSLAYFQSRRLYKPLTQRGLDETFLVDNLHVQSEQLPEPALASAPFLGEHTVDIAREILGLSPTEIRDLLERRVIEIHENTATEKSDAQDRSIARARS